jgi:membrane-bound lytic murein transglycosylase F
MRGRSLLWLLVAMLPALAIAGVSHHVKHDRWTDDYDHLFRKYTKHYFGAHFDWHWFKAQAIAESALNPDARSPMGAVGIMQILPSTYAEIKGQNPFLANIEDPRWNIAAGIFYDRQLYRKWKKKGDIHTGERLSFAFGSYNAGFGNVLKGYKRAHKKYGEVPRWQRVEPYVPKETRHYVARIHSLMQVVD